MTTIEEQKQMFYAGGRAAARKALSDFITERHKQRFSLVEAWRVNGSSEEGWREIEKFDEDTERQERILSDMGT